MATQFLAKIVWAGELGVIVAFEKSPSHLHSNRHNKKANDGNIELINTLPKDQGVDRPCTRSGRALRCMYRFPCTRAREAWNDEYRA
jgi:hypothetical protein